MRAALGLLGLFAAIAGAAEPVITVGAAMPISGEYAHDAEGYRKGLVLWQEELNAAAGLLGRRVELRVLDDRSSASAVPALYRRLIDEEGAQLLVGPFGSAASLGAAAVAERAGRVIVNATGATRSVQRRTYRFVFPLAAPYTRLAAGALEVARAREVRSMLILALRDPASREPAEWLRDEARRLGVAAGEIAGVAAGQKDFAALVAAARAAGTQAWIAFCPARESAEMVKAFRQVGYAPQLFVAQGAAHADFMRALGRDAEGALGIAPYLETLPTRGNAEFVRAYRARWNEAPGLYAAQGYAAGKVLERAVQGSGSLDPERLRTALAALDTETPLGGYRIDPQSGAQIGYAPALTQIQNGRLEIVWPAAYATAPARLPYYPGGTPRAAYPALQALR